MPSAQEIAQLYFTLDAKAGPGAEQVLDDQIVGFEDLAEVAEETGIPIGQLRQLVNELIEEIDPATVAAEALAEGLEAVAEATGESISALQQQVRLYAQGAQIEATRYASLERLSEIEQVIKQRLVDGNTTLDQRIRLETVLAQAHEVLFEKYEELAEVTDDGIGALQREVRMHQQGVQVAATRAASLAKLSELETQIKQRLAVGNTTLEQRILLEKTLASTQATLLASQARAAGATNGHLRVLREGTGTVKAFGDRWGMSALQIVDAAANVAQAGALSGRSLKGMLLGATSLVGFIGTGGALVAAAGIGAQAIITLFTRARDEAKKLTVEFKKEITDLQNAGDFVGLKDKLAGIFQGTAAADFKDGLGFIDSEIKKLEEKLKRTELFAGGFGIQKQIDELKAKKKPLQEQFDAIAAVILNGKVALERAGAQPIKSEVLSLEAAQRAAQQLQDQNAQTAASFRDIAQGFGDLARSVSGGQNVLQQYDKAVRELRDRFAALKHPTDDQRKAFAELDATAGKVRATLKGLEASRAAKTFRELQASLTATAVDDLQNGLEELLGTINTLRSQGAIDEASARQLVEIQLELIRAKADEEQLEQAIHEVVKKKISAMDAQLALAEILLRKEEELKKITGTDEVSKRRVLLLEAQIAKLKAEIAALGGKTTDQTNETATSLQKWTGYLESAAGAAFGVASALRGSENSITRMLGSTLQMVSGFSQIADLASKTSGGLSALFSSGAGIASALPGLGAILGGGIALAGILGKKAPPDPAEQERLRVLRANNERLAELRQSLDRQAQLTIAGGKASAIRDVVLTRPDVGIGEDGQPVTGFGPRDIRLVMADLRALGVSLADLQQAAQDLGVTLSETPTIVELAALQEAIRLRGLRELFAGLTGELKRFELAAELDPDAFAGLEGVMKRLAILTGPNGVPAIAEALAGLDPNSPTYLQDVVAALTELGLTADDIDLAKLGDLSPDEFLAEIVRLVTGIRQNIPKAKSAVDLFTEALDGINAAFEFGATDAKGRLAGTFDALKKFFPDLAAQLDFSSEEGLKASIAKIVAAFNADGELTEAEKAQLAILRELLAAYGAVTQAAKDAADAAEEEADAKRRAEEDAQRDRERAEAELARAEDERRRRVLRLAEAYIAANNIDDPLEQLRIRVEALKRAYPELLAYLDDFDLSTEEGRAALERWLETMIATPEALQNLADILGISFDELLSMLSDLESGAAKAATQVATLAETLNAAFADVDFSIALEGITDPVEKLLRLAAAASKDASIAKAISGADLRTAAGRAKAEAALIALGKSTADEATRNAILKLLEGIRGSPKDDATALAAALTAASPSPTKDGSDSGRATFLAEDLRFAQLLDYSSRTAVAVEGMWALLQSRVAPIAPPVLSPQAATAAAIFGGASLAAAGSVKGEGGGLHVTVTLQFLGTVYLGSREDASEIITPAVAEGVLQAAGRQFTVQRQLKGRGTRG